MSTLFGQSGVLGFNQKTDMLFQSTNKIFTHTNTIRRDVIESKWMPFFKANKDCLYNDFLESLKKEKIMDKKKLE